MHTRRRNANDRPNDSRTKPGSENSTIQRGGGVRKGIEGGGGKRFGFGQFVKLSRIVGFL